MGLSISHCGSYAFGSYSSAYFWSPFKISFGSSEVDKGKALLEKGFHTAVFAEALNSPITFFSR
ncbi:hypothetical protein D3C87_1414430 [compost metagenome]